MTAVDSVIAGSQGEPESADRDGAATIGRIRRLMIRLGWLPSVIVVATGLAISLSFYSFQARPLAQAELLARQTDAENIALTQTEAMTGTVELSLLTIRDWGRDGLIGLDDLPQLNRFLIPFLQEQSRIGAIHLANESGREIMLLHTSEGWRNRVVDVARTGKAQRWMKWLDSHVAIDEKIVEEDYDPRRTPWYGGAMTMAEKQIFWTEPSLLPVSNQPGMTAALHWKDTKSGQQIVLSIDLQLAELGSFVSGLKYGDRGYVTLLSANGKLLSLPNRYRLGGDADRATALMQPPGFSGLRSLDTVMRLASLARSGNGSTKITVPGADSEDGHDWLASLLPIKVGNQSLRLVTLAPKSEFAAVKPPLLAILLFIGGMITLASVLLLRSLVGEARKPIVELIAANEASHLRAERESARHALVLAISDSLQQADSPSELGAALLSRLAPDLELGQGLFCLWDEPTRRLQPAACYGGVAGDDPRFLAASSFQGGLLHQSAQSGEAILIEQPGDDYLRIRSGLGDSLPKTILIRPIQHRGTLFAMLELASFRSFTEDDHRLLAELDSVVVVSLNSLVRAQSSARSPS